jgi:hypothetical protein
MGDARRKFDNLLWRMSDIRYLTTAIIFVFAILVLHEQCHNRGFAGILAAGAGIGIILSPRST